jgi:DNA polymerase/3'-5' exonuclease PolX
MNVECQTIKVPHRRAGLPAGTFGGIAAVELGVTGVSRTAIDVDPRELEQRIVLAYTGAPRNSGTKNWEITKRHIDGDQHVFDCFERIRDTAVAMRTALERGDWDEVGRQIAIEWVNRKRLAPGVTTPTNRRPDLPGELRRGDSQPRCAAPGGGGCLFCYGPPSARSAIAAALAGAARASSTTGSRPKACGLDNPAIARILREIADLLEIKGENPFKIRAYRNCADIAANHPHELSLLDETGLRRFPGIGKDLAGRIREISQTGDAEFHRELLAEFPATILDLLSLQGVGPKTVATLYRDLGIRTLDDLEKACTDGRIRALKGMGAKKEALILKALDERKRFAGRHLLSHAHDASTDLQSYLRERATGAVIEAVGSLRRGCDTCGDLDLLATGAPPTLMDDFIEYRLVERVLGHGETKSSVLLQGGFQADLRLVVPESRGAAMQYFTGSKAHNIALRDRANRTRPQAERVRPLPDRRRQPHRRRAGRRYLRRAGPRVGTARTARNARRD